MSIINVLTKSCKPRLLSCWYLCVYMEAVAAGHSILPRAMVIKNYIGLMIVFLLYPIYADTGSSYIKYQKLSGGLLVFKSMIYSNQCSKM